MPQNTEEDYKTKNNWILYFPSLRSQTVATKLEVNRISKEKGKRFPEKYKFDFSKGLLTLPIDLNLEESMTNYEAKNY